jgi:hypothetical protein
LERHGFLLTVRENTGERGRPGTAYWANFEQGMVICSLSRTPRAEDVRFIMIRVFSRVVNGGISTASPIELKTLEVFAQVTADRVVQPILRQQNEFQVQVFERMDRHEERLSGVEGAIVDVKKVVGYHRYDVIGKDKAIHICVCDKCMNGICPCCQSEKIVANGEKLPNLAFDHFYGRDKRKLKETWPVCTTCNQQLEIPDIRASKLSNFQAYQGWVVAYQREFDKQLRLY